LVAAAGQRSNSKAPVPGPSSKVSGDVGRHVQQLAGMPAADLGDLIQQLTEQMHGAAAELQFELAARLRDEITEL
jgi:excinuclease ABC subunit B